MKYMSKEEAIRSMLDGNKVSYYLHPNRYMYYDKHSKEFLKDTGKLANLNSLIGEGFIIHHSPKDLTQAIEYLENLSECFKNSSNISDIDKADGIDLALNVIKSGVDSDEEF